MAKKSSPTPINSSCKGMHDKYITNTRLRQHIFKLYTGFGDKFPV